MEKGAGAAEILALHPQSAALELQHREWERRSTPVATYRRPIPALRLVHLTALAVGPCKSCGRAEINASVNRSMTNRERLLIASKCLIDRSALCIDVNAIATQGDRVVEVGHSRGEPMEGGPHFGARDERSGVGRHLVHELVRHRGGPLGVGNP